MYRLNGINLSDYGIVVSKFEGYLNMPSRRGKTEQTWADEEGIEAFTDADDIHFNGRDLTLTGYFEGNSHLGLISTAQGFYNAIIVLTDLVALETPYGTFQVYLKNGADANYLGGSFTDLKIKFREPVANFTGTLGTGAGVKQNGIDNYDFLNDFGIQITEFSGNYSSPEMKGFSPTSYISESSAITNFNTTDLTVSGYCNDLTKISALYTLLASAGEHDLRLKYDKGRKFYMKDGTTFKWIKNGKGLIEMKFRLINPFVEFDYLAYSAGNYILTKDRFRIIIN